MSVFKRKSQGGETREYHYKFMQSGKWYYGVCEGCTTEREALAYEKNIRETAKKLAGQQSVGALVENFKKELTGGGKVPLKEAFVCYMAKPRRKQPGPQHQFLGLCGGLWLESGAWRGAEGQESGR